jgi:hypothetical protein
MRIKQARSSQLYFIEVVEKLLNLPPRPASLHHDRGKIAAGLGQRAFRRGARPGMNQLDQAAKPRAWR